MAGKLWYADCLSGPWNARSAELTDTSVVIGLEVLQDQMRAFFGLAERDLPAGLDEEGLLTL